MIYENLISHFDEEKYLEKQSILNEQMNLQRNKPRQGDIDVGFLITGIPKSHLRYNKYPNSRQVNESDMINKYDKNPRVKFITEKIKKFREPETLIVRADINDLHYYDGNIKQFSNEQIEDISRFIYVNYKLIYDIWYTFGHETRSGDSDIRIEKEQQLITNKNKLRTLIPNPIPLIFKMEPGQDIHFNKLKNIQR